jgi:hypothetical protein
MTAEEFNQRYDVGTSVNYHPIIGDPEHKKTRTLSEAWTHGSGEPMVKVEGQTGGVSLEAITIDPEIERYIDLGNKIENHPLDCLCSDCRAFMTQGDKTKAMGLRA